MSHGISTVQSAKRILAIQIIVAEVYNTSVDDMKSRRRPERIAWPRQVAMHFCYLAGLGSYEEIGKHFGGRDHGTVMHAYRHVPDRVKGELQQIKRYLHCRSSINQSLGMILPTIELGNGVGTILPTILDWLGMAKSLISLDFPKLAKTLAPEEVKLLNAELGVLDNQVLAPLRSALGAISPC